MRGSVAVCLLVGLLSGCANITETKLMSTKSVFLTPGAVRTVYIQNRNISENQQVTLEGLAGKLTAKGYRVMPSPEQAQFLVQTKVVYCNQERDSASFQSALSSGFGAGIGSGGMEGMMGGGGMADLGMRMAQMSGIGMGGQAPNDAILYFCAVDVQVTEQGKGGVVLSAPTNASRAASVESGRHQTRILAGVRQKKLNVEEATPIVREKLTTSVAGIF